MSPTTATTTAEVTTSTTGRVLRPRPTTKTSIRQTLGLTSMGKAIADVMHKDRDGQGDKEKQSKKIKDAAARRGNLVPATTQPPSEKAAGVLTSERSSSPETKVVTKPRRMSGLPKASALAATSSEDSSSNTVMLGQRAAIGRSKTLHPRNPGGTGSSGLPKYRPKSMLVESTSAKKPPSPVHVGIRRKLSSSDDEKEDKGKPTLRLNLAPTSLDICARAISPLPHRGALQINLSSAINVRPATPERRTKTRSPTPLSSSTRSSPARTSSVRTRKPSKLGPPPSASASGSAPALDRPSSSASASSSSSSRRAPSPTTPSATRRTTPKASSSIKVPKPIHKRSPLASIFTPHEDIRTGNATTARRRELNSSPSPLRVADTSLIVSTTPIGLTEGVSIDSIDANDVEYMLSSTVSPAAPTPGLPRIQTSLLQDDSGPHTPSRSKYPARSNMSFLSATRPEVEDSPFLRPRGRLYPGNDRTSILSWEQLAAHSNSLGADEIESMLSVDAPFNPNVLSPALTSLTELPESPSVSTMPSPTGYGSISQVLLPAVTPSPAVHNAPLHYDDFVAEAPQMDSGTVTMLKLQVVSLENTALERMMKIEYLESQLQTAREARLRDAEELSKQVTELEEQLQASLLPDEQLTEKVTSLEEQLRHAQTAQEQAVREALEKAQAEQSVSEVDALQTHYAQWDAANAACEAKAAWRVVSSTAESELEHVRSNKAMLAVLLAGLDYY